MLEVLLMENLHFLTSLIDTDPTLFEFPDLSPKSISHELEEQIEGMTREMYIVADC
jgi:hypothetical protein